MKPRRPPNWIDCWRSTVLFIDSNTALDSTVPSLYVQEPMDDGEADQEGMYGLDGTTLSMSYDARYKWQRSMIRFKFDVDKNGSPW